MLLMNSRGNGFFASGKQTICKYVQACCTKITPTTSPSPSRSRSRAADKHVVLQSTSTRLELMPETATVTRKKFHKLIQRKYKQVICFKSRRMATTRCQRQHIKNVTTTTTCCELRSNNGSYFSKTKKRNSQQRLYYYNNNGNIKKRIQHQEQQHINMIKRNLQILRLYARSGVHLRRRRKRRFFINLYTNTLQFRKLKAIKTNTALMHNNMMPLKATISLSSLEQVTVNSTLFHNKRNQFERTKSCTIQQEEEEKYEQQQEEYKFEKSNDNQIYSLSTSAHSNSKNGNGSWRLLLTSLIALTASTGTGLSTELSGTLRKTLTTLFKQVQRGCCQLNILNKKYSWIFLLIYLHLTAKGKST